MCNAIVFAHYSFTRCGQNVTFQDHQRIMHCQILESPMPSPYPATVVRLAICREGPANELLVGLVLKVKNHVPLKGEMLLPTLRSQRLTQRGSRHAKWT